MKNGFLKNTMRNDLRVNIVYMFLSNLLYAIFNWLQLSVIAKFSSSETLGVYTLIIAMVTPMYLLSNMQLRTLILTNNEKEYSFSEYFSFRIYSLCILFVSLILVTLIYKIELILPMTLFLILKVIEGISEIPNSISQKRDFFKNILYSVSSKSFAVFLGIFIGVYFYNNLVWGLCISIFLSGLIMIGYDMRRYKLKFFPNLTSPFYKKIFVTLLPLAIVIFITSINSNISKFYLDYFLGIEEQGVYSSLSYTIILGSFICNAIGQAIIPRFSASYSEGNYTQFKRYKNKFLYLNILVGVLVVLLSITCGEKILKLLFNEKIATYQTHFILLMIAALFIYISTALGYTLTAMKEFKIQPYINAFTLIFNCICSFFFVKYWGILGAIYSLMMVYIVQTILTAIYIEYRLLKQE